MQEYNKNSNFSTLILMIIKELRFERNIHQSYLANAVNKSPSAWTKIENGQSVLAVDTFYGVSHAFQLAPGYITNIADRLMNVFGINGYYFSPGTLDAKEDKDDLLELMLQYFNSPGIDLIRTNQFQRVSVTALLSPYFIENPTIVRYCIDKSFREWFDKQSSSGFYLDSNSLDNNKIY